MIGLVVQRSESITAPSNITDTLINVRDIVMMIDIILSGEGNDADGDGLGNGISEDFCAADVPSGWVLNNADMDDSIFCYSNEFDDCGVCDGESFYNESGELSDGSCGCDSNIEVYGSGDVNMDGFLNVIDLP